MSSPRLDKLLGNQPRNPLGISRMNAEQQERYEHLLKEFQEIDINGDQSLTFKEVYSFLHKKSKGELSEHVVMDLFNNMDKDHDSEVTTKEFIQTYIEAEDALNLKIEVVKKQIADYIFHIEDYKKKLLKAKQEEIRQSNGIMVDSVMTVHVIDGMNLRISGISPFVELICENQVIETEPKPCDPNPVFKEAFTFKIIKGNEDLQILLKDAKTQRKCGAGFYSLESLKDQMKKDVLVDITDPKTDQSIGRLHLELQWIYSKVKYFEDIIVQINKELEEAKLELNQLEQSLVKLSQPFGMFYFGKIKSNINSKEAVLAKRIENMAFGIIGRDLRWKVVFTGFMASFLLACVIEMFFTPDFLNLIIAIFGALQSIRKHETFGYRKYSYFLVATCAFDVCCLLISGRFWPSPNFPFQYIGLAVTITLIGLKVLLAAVCFKFSVDIPNI